METIPYDGGVGDKEERGPSNAILWTLAGLGVGVALIVAIALLAAWLGVPGTERLQSPPTDESSPGFWRVVGADVATAATWLLRILVYCGAAGLLMALFTWLRQLLPPVDRVDMELEDRTAPVGTRPSASAELVQQVAAACRRIAESTGGQDAFVVELSALPRSTAITQELLVLAKHVDDGAIALGPLSFSPRQLLAWLTSLVRRPPRRIVTGWLEEVDNSLRLYAEVRDTQEPESLRDLRADAPGTSARARIVDLFACRILGSEARSIATQVPASLSAYIDGLNQLRDSAEAENVVAVIEGARESLEESVRFDPSNLPARLLLGEVLRNSHENRLASQQFQFVLDVLTQHERTRGVAHPLVKKRSDIVWRCRYQLISALTQVPRKRFLDRATREHRKLVDMGEGTSLAQRIFRMAARAQLVLQEMEMLRHDRRQRPSREPDYEGRMSQRLRTIERIESRLWRMFTMLQEQLPEVAGQAHALLQNAAGRAHYLCGRYYRAQRYLEWVVTIYRPVLDSRPYAFLASVLMRRRQHAGGDWRSRAESLLVRALEIHPHSERANYLMGKLITQTPDGDPTEADTYFAQSESSQSLFARGRLWVEQLDRVDAGLALVRRSLKADPTLDRRRFWLARRLAERALKGEADLWPELTNCIEDLRTDGRDEWLEWIRSIEAQRPEESSDQGANAAKTGNTAEQDEGEERAVMTYEADIARLEADLANPQFTCYLYVGDEADEGWEHAKFVHGLVTRLNIYLFQDHSLLATWVGNKRPKGIAFGWNSDIKQTLSAVEARDLGIVVTAISGAQQ